MNFDLNNKKEVIALLGAGSMGTAIVRRIAAGKKILLGDISQKNLEATANALRYCSYDVETQIVDACDKDSIEAYAKRAAKLGAVKYYIHTAGASPSQASPEKIVELDLIGTAYAIDAFGRVMAKGGAGLVVSSQTGYMNAGLTPEDERELALTPTEELKDLKCISKENLTSSGKAYMISKRANHLRVRTAANSWGERGARINTISPGIIVTPLAYDEFQAQGAGYQKMIDSSPAKRTGTPDEVAAAGAFLLGAEAGFITGTDLLIDGGVIAAIESGRYSLGGN